jgi:tryptophan synthase beta subunit
MRKRVLDEAGKGNKGRANAILAVALERIRETYLALPEETRVEPMHYEGTLLDGNVAAVLEGVPVPKYQRGG